MAKKADTALVPGVVLKDLLAKYNIPVAKISDDIGLIPSAIRQLIKNKLKISIVIALKLGKYFGKKPEYWIDLQTAYELAQLLKDPKNTAELKKIAEATKQPAADKKTGRGAAKAVAAETKPRGRPGRKPGAAKAAAAKPAAEKKPRKPRTPRAKPAPVDVSPEPDNSWQ
jgi:addiction module HigA family antidote